MALLGYAVNTHTTGTEYLSCQNLQNHETSKQISMKMWLIVGLKRIVKLHVRTNVIIST